jgi:hypothetical protein
MTKLTDDKETYLGDDYLGDGLYASFDGWAITLRAPRMEGDHFVVLGPEAYAALLRFVTEHYPREGRQTMTPMSPDLKADNVGLIVESEPLKDAPDYISWRITGRDWRDVAQRVIFLSGACTPSGYASFTPPTLVEFGEFTDWYRSLGITCETPRKKEAPHGDQV